MNQEEEKAANLMFNHDTQCSNGAFCFDDSGSL